MTVAACTCRLWEPCTCGAPRLRIAGNVTPSGGQVIPDTAAAPAPIPPSTPAVLWHICPTCGAGVTTRPADDALPDERCDTCWAQDRIDRRDREPARGTWRRV